MRRYIIFCICIFCQLCVFTQGKNRFVEMSQLPRIDYQYAVNEYLYVILFFDVKELNQEIERLNEFEAGCRNNEWKEIAKFLHIILDAKLLDKDFTKANYNINDIHVRYLDLYDQTKSEYVRWKTLRIIAHQCWYELQNFESTFEHLLHLCKSIENLPDSIFLDKLTCYVELADKYYYFKEYDKAMFWHNKVTKTIDRLHPYNQLTMAAAYNGLGLCYRHKENFEMSNLYFNKILTFISAFDWETRIFELWEGIAKGNLGDNLYLEGKYDEAIPLLKFSLNSMSKHLDFAYASGTAITLSDIYLKKGIFDRAYYYGNLAYDYEQRLTRSGRLESIYFFFNKYYIATHNTNKALLYLDSAVNEQTKNDALFSANKLLRVEQRMNLLEQKAKDKEIALTKKQMNIYLRNMIIIASFAVIILVLLFFLYSSLRKKRLAYQALVLKSQQWANIKQNIDINYTDKENTIDSTNQNTEATTIDTAIMEMVYRAFEQDKIYTDNAITIQSMADLLKTNRSYLSKAINATTGHSFNILINEYRIKEAIKLLSNPKFDYMSIDNLSEEVGFANRYTFYSAFKKSVGITPAEFRRNRNVLCSD